MAIPKIRLDLARQLRKLRKKHKLTQEGLAESAGLDARYYQQLESKKPGAVKIDTLDRLGKALKVPVWKLLQFKD